MQQLNSPPPPFRLCPASGFRGNPSIVGRSGSPRRPQSTNTVVLPIRPITSVSTVAPVDAAGKEPQRRPSRRDSDLRSLAELPRALKSRAVSEESARRHSTAGCIQ